MNKENNTLINNLNSIKNYVSIKVWTTWFQTIISFWLWYILTMIFVKSSYIFLNWEVVLTIYIWTILVGWIVSISLTHIINAIKYFMNLD